MRRLFALLLALVCLPTLADVTTIVAVGLNGKAATSPDGVTWTARTLPSGNYYAVTWNGTVFAAVGDSVAATSPDGITWTAAAIPSGAYVGVAWNGSVFAAVGPGVAATSTDGTVWTSRTIPSGFYNSVAWNGATFAVVGDHAASSPDGVTWTAQPLPAPNDLVAYDTVAWNGLRFVAVGTQSGHSGLIMASVDGTGWSIVPGAPSTTLPIVALAWNGSIFAAATSATAAAGQTFHSSDGLTWSPAGSGGPFWAIHANGSTFVGVGQDIAETSPDGVTWTPQSIPGGTYNALAVSVQPSPLLSGIAPTSGLAAGGTSITITGTGFRSGATVTVGGVAATLVNVASDTQITATTPAHTPGQVDVVVTNPDNQLGTLYSAFAYFAANAPAPTITGVSPSHGALAGGDTVTLSGTGFQAGATMSFGGTPATNVAVQSASMLTATVPAHAAGAVQVAIANPDSQSGTLDAAYTYDAAQAPPPTLSGISNPGGLTSGGYSLTLTGTGFQTGATVTLGGAAATNVVVVSASEITLTAPAHDAGAVDVVVTNPDAQSATLAGAFLYATSSGSSGCGNEGGLGALALLALGLLPRRRRYGR